MNIKSVFKKIIILTMIISLCSSNLEVYAAYPVGDVITSTSTSSLDDKISNTNEDGDKEILELVDIDDSERYQVDNGSYRTLYKYNVSVTLYNHGISTITYEYINGSWVKIGTTGTDQPTYNYTDSEGYSGTLSKSSSELASESGAPPSNPQEGDTYTITRYWNATYTGTLSKEVWVSDWVWEGYFKGIYEGVGYDNEEIVASFANAPNSELVGDPVNIVTGNYYSTFNDLTLNDIGMSIIISRYYNSLDSTIGLLGKGWKFNYESTLSVDSETDEVTVTYSDGHQITFTPVENTNNYLAPVTINDELIKNADNTYNLKLQNKQIYHYTVEGKLNNISDLNGNTISFTYDTDNNLSSIISPSGKILTVSMLDDKISQITDETGRYVKYIYDASNNLIEVETAEGTKKYTYNADGLTSASDLNGNIFIENLYDEFGRVVWQVDGEGNEITYEYSESTLTNKIITEASSSEVAYTYDLNLYITKKTFSDGTYEEYTYDENGNKISSRNRNGNTVTYTYDERGNVTSVTSPEPYNYTTLFTYDTEDNLTKILKPDGGEQRFTYDSKGNMTQSEIKLDALTTSVTKFSYDSYGRILTVTDAENNITSYEYTTGYSLPTTITDPEGNMITYTYDELDRVKTITTHYGTTSFEYNTSNNIVKITDALGNITRMRYDAVGNLLEVINPEQYNESTDSGVGYTFDYDTMDRLIKQVDPLDNIFRTQYDVQGNVIRDINPNHYNETTDDGLGISYEYDKDNRKIKIINPSGEASRIKYDGLGNIIKTIDANQYNESTDDGKGIEYSYDELNRVVQVTDAEGNVIKRYVYDSAGRVIKSIDAEGYLSGSTDSERYGTLYTYNLAGWLTEVRTPMKEEGLNTYYNVMKYEYDKLGRVISEIKSPSYVTLTQDPVEYNAINYTYDKNSRIKTITDSTGAYVSYSYNGSGDVTEQTMKISDSISQTRGYEYDALGRVTKQWMAIDGNDLAEDNTGIVKAETSYSYDKNGNVIEIISPEGYKTQFEYDNANRLIAMTEEVSEDWLNETHVKASIISPMSKVYGGQTYDYTVVIDPEELISAFELDIEYDARIFEVVTTTAANENITINTDTIGQISIDAIEQSVDAKTVVGTVSFKVKEGITGIGSITFNQTSTYTDVDSNIKSFTELAGQSADLRGPDMNNDGSVEANDLTLTALNKDMDTTQPYFEYKFDVDGSGVIDIPDLDYITDWIFKDKSNTLTALDHQIFTQKIMNPRYDKGQNVITRTTTYEYDKAGNLVKETDYKGDFVTYSYDEYNHLTKLTDKEGNNYRYFYDELGNVIKEVLPENYNETTDDGLGMTYTYDSMNRLSTVVNEAGTIIEKNIYNTKGQLVKSIDAEGYLAASTDTLRYGMEYSYDIGGRVIAITTPESKDKGKTTVTYTYDALGNILTVTDGEDNKTTYERDLWGRATVITNEKGISEYYTYDLAGNVTSSKDGNGNITTYTYNSMNLLKEITDPEGNSISYKYDKEGRLVEETDKKGQVIKYTYNSNYNLTSKSIEGLNETENFLYSKDGSLLAAITNNGIERYEYTTNGNLAKKIFNGEEQLSYNYNKQGQVTNITDKEGKEINYNYNILGRLSTVSDSDNNLATYTYNLDNTIADITYSNGVITTYSYDKNNNISTIVHEDGLGNIINTLNHTYDNNDNMISKVENGQTTTYAYDAVNQLVEVNYPEVGIETYNYDDAGNRTEKTIAGITTTYQYNSLNQLTSFNENSIITSYEYDLNGNMTYETTNEEITTYTYNGYNRLTEVVKPDGTWQKNYYNAMGLRSAVEENGIYTGFIYDGWNVVSELNSHNQIIRTNIRGYNLLASKDQVGRDYYYLQNAHSDIINILDQDGNIENSYTYDAYGNITQSEELISNRYTYAGEQYDSVTGNYYLRARYYNPTVGRFMQEDTYRGDGLNLYAYVANNPIMYVDPSGHDKDCSMVIVDQSLPLALAIPLNPSMVDPATLESVKEIIIAAFTAIATVIAIDSINTQGGVSSYDPLTAYTGENYSAPNWGPAAISIEEPMDGSTYFPIFEPDNEPYTFPIEEPTTPLILDPLIEFDLPNLPGTSTLDEPFGNNVTQDPIGESLSGGNILYSEGTGENQRGVGGKGWRGDKNWRDAVKDVADGGTINDINGQIPTEQEAIDLINEAGGEVLRVEGPHETPNPHNFPHINYKTPSGGKGTIEILP